MDRLSLEQLFGEGASQDENFLFILKASLPNLTVINVVRAESFLIAILLQACTNFEGELTDEQGRTITDEKGISVVYNNSSLYERLKVWRWITQFTKILGVTYIIDSIIIDALITPPTPPGEPLDPNLFN